MKLLFCKKCGMVFSLSLGERCCSCEKSKGVYLDQRNAVYSGPCVPLGFSNNSFLEATSMEEKGLDFSAFVISPDCPTFTRKDGPQLELSFPSDPDLEYDNAKRIVELQKEIVVLQKKLEDSAKAFSTVLRHYTQKEK